MQVAGRPVTHADRTLTLTRDLLVRTPRTCGGHILGSHHKAHHNARACGVASRSVVQGRRRRTWAETGRRLRVRVVRHLTRSLGEQPWVLGGGGCARVVAYSEEERPSQRGGRRRRSARAGGLRARRVSSDVAGGALDLCGWCAAHVRVCVRMRECVRGAADACRRTGLFVGGGDVGDFAVEHMDALHARLLERVMPIRGWRCARRVDHTAR
jgi:hypothetical protein